MQIITVGANEDGQRLDRLVEKVIPLAGKGFIYKMLRKKNIVLNGKKAEGSERVSVGDEIKLFLSDETIAGFSSASSDVSGKLTRTGAKALESEDAGFDFKESIVYEDSDIILSYKPQGILTQKAKESDVSLNEYLIRYLLESGSITSEQLKTFKPSVCNRLDRNTCGIVACGKSLKGSRELSRMFKDRSIGKYYLCLVKGSISGKMDLKGWLVKDEKTNKVTLSDHKTCEEAEPVETSYRPLKTGKEMSLLEVKLITGKTHQIRAHLASIGHPIAGDPKYGDGQFNKQLKEKSGTVFQQLEAYKIVFPADCELRCAGRTFTADRLGLMNISI